MNLAVVGSREFTDFNFLEKSVLDLELKIDVDTIVSGGCRGTDKLAEQYAKKYNKKLIIHKPDWSKGKIAGPLRNSLIVNDSDCLIAFPNDTSKGTYDTIKKAKLKGIPVTVIKVDKS